MARRIMKLALGVVSVILLIVAFAGVASNQSARDNRVIDKVDLTQTDKYMADEVIKTWYGQVGLTNVEEFGTNGSKVSAIIHYKNTTNEKITLAPSEMGKFMDESFDYKMYGVGDEKVEYQPGDTAEFRVYIKRDKGLDGLTYLVSEPAKGGFGIIADDTQVVYQSSIDLNMLNQDMEEKSEFYGMSPEYTEEVSEDSIGRDKEHVDVIASIEEYILITEEDESVAKEERERIEEAEQNRQEALNYLNSIK